MGCEGWVRLRGQLVDRSVDVELSMRAVPGRLGVRDLQVYCIIESETVQLHHLGNFKASVAIRHSVPSLYTESLHLKYHLRIL